MCFYVFYFPDILILALDPCISLSLSLSLSQYLSVLCNGTLRPHVIYVEATTEDRIKELKQTDVDELPAPQRKLHVRHFN